MGAGCTPFLPTRVHNILPRHHLHGPSRCCNNTDAFKMAAQDCSCIPLDFTNTSLAGEPTSSTNAIVGALERACNVTLGAC